MMIVLTHVHQIFDLPVYMKALPQLGQLGCQIFFVISGFFAFNPHWENLFDGKTILDYYKKKVRRIVPGYWLTIALGVTCALLSVYFFGDSKINISVKKMDVLLNVLLVNGVVPTSANNHVVRGGWFVGTLMIFYALTPFLSYFFNTYFKNKLLLPIIAFGFSAMILITLGWLNPEWTCKNNSFFYFLFVNQMPCFLLGFSLKDYYIRGEVDSIRHSCLMGLLMSAVSIMCFFLGGDYLTNVAYVVTPFAAGLATFFFSCLFLKQEKKIKEQSTLLKAVVVRFGELDYVIMLIHPFIVFDLGAILRHFINIPHVFLFLILLPIEFIVVYWCAKVYQKMIKKVTVVVFGEER